MHVVPNTLSLANVFFPSIRLPFLDKPREAEKILYCSALRMPPMDPPSLRRIPMAGGLSAEFSKKMKFNFINVLHSREVFGGVQVKMKSVFIFTSGHSLRSHDCRP